MNARHIATALLVCMPLVACGNSSKAPATSTTPQASTTQPKSALGKMVQSEIREARERLATENIRLNDGVSIIAGEHSRNSGDDRKDDRPKAEITPQGDLLIEGKAVAVNAQQRAMLLEYRTHVIGVAESAMEIGVQSADLAATAMGEAFKGIFSGKSEQDIEKSVEAEASGIKATASKLCGRLPAMMATQQKLAASLPEFKPYATMTQEDIDECMKDSQDDRKHAQLRSEIRDEIRTTVRESVRNEVRQAVGDDNAKDNETNQSQ